MGTQTKTNTVQPIWTYTYTKNTGDRVLLTLLQSFHHNHIYKCYLASSLCHGLYERIVVIWSSNITISVKMWFVWSMSNSIKHDVDDGKGDNGDYLIFAWALATLVDLVSHFLKYWLPKLAWVIFVVNSHNQRDPCSENDAKIFMKVFIWSCNLRLYNLQGFFVKSIKAGEKFDQAFRNDCWNYFAWVLSSYVVIIILVVLFFTSLL